MIATTAARANVRVVVWLAIGLVLAVSLIDAGSIVLTRMRVDDDLKSAGFAGATAIRNKEVSGETAQLAYSAAVGSLNDGERIDPETFAIRSDGSITLTVRMTAPTLAFKHLDFLNGFTEVESTYQQPGIGY